MNTPSTKDKYPNTKYVNFTRTFLDNLSSSIECPHSEAQVQFYLNRVTGAGYTDVSITDEPLHSDVIKASNMGEATYKAYNEQFAADKTFHRVKRKDNK